jgi:hypothetical protein
MQKVTVINLICKYIDTYGRIALIQKNIIVDNPGASDHFAPNKLVFTQGKSWTQVPIQGAGN